MLLGAALARAAGVKAPAYNIENSVKAFSMDAIDKTAGGYVHWFFDKGFAQDGLVKLSVVRPGAANHPPHRHEGHEFFFVLLERAKSRVLPRGRDAARGPANGAVLRAELVVTRHRERR